MKVLFIALFVTLASARSYFGDKVFRLHPEEEKHFQFLEFLEDQVDMVEFWKPITVKGLRTPIPVDVRIPRKNIKRVSGLIKNSGIRSEVMIENMQELIDNQFDSPLRNHKERDGDNYREYHTYEEIMQWVNDLEEGYPKVVQAHTLATSSLGLEVPYLVLGSDAGLDSSRRILISCGENAREWISPAVCECIAAELASDYGWDEKHTEMLDKSTIIIVPVLNVDGYNYSWVEDRNWVKTRSHYSEDFCVGVNTDTNFDINYGGPGTSQQSCLNLYRGPHAESEPEVEGLSNLIRDWDPEIFISFQAYGQQILYPYFYDRTSPLNEENLILTANKMKNMIALETRKEYPVLAGHLASVLSSGRSADYAAGANGDFLAYQIQLPDDGTYGYLLPESEIVVACEDAMIIAEVAFEELLPDE